MDLSEVEKLLSEIERVVTPDRHTAYKKEVKKRQKYYLANGKFLILSCIVWSGE